MMEAKRRNKKLVGALDLLAVLVFSLSLIYILDDVIQVLSLGGVAEGIAFYVFVVGPLILFPLSLFFWKKLRIERFGLYAVLASIQIFILIAFTYILLNSQV